MLGYPRRLIRSLGSFWLLCRLVNFAGGRFWADSAKRRRGLVSRFAACWAFICWTLIFSVSKSLAQDGSVAPDASTIRKWVEELGDRRFEVRDQASFKLGRLSTDQLDFLKEILGSSSDPEITVRLSSVVAKLKAERQREVVRVFLRDTNIFNDHGLHGWSSFAKVAGTNRSSKRLFLQLYDRYPELVEESLEDPKQAGQIGLGIVKRIQQDEVRDMRRVEADKVDGLALLYCTCVANGDGGQQQTNLLPISLRVLLRAPYNQCLRDPQSKRPIETMMDLWAASIQGGYEQSTALQIMLESNLASAKTLAKRMLQEYRSGNKAAAEAAAPPAGAAGQADSEGLDPKDVMRAFQVYFRFGRPEDIPELEQWLDNDDICEELVSMNLPGGMVPRVQVPGGLPPIPGGVPPNGQQPNRPNGNPNGNPNQERPLATVELRDVALLTCMQIAGLDYRNHFPSVRQSPLWGFIPNSIALPAGSQAIRDARLEAWKKSRP